MEVIKIIPIAWLITQLPFMLEGVNQMLKGWRRAIQVLISILSCLKCVSFWLTLVYTRDIVLASQIALISFLIDNHLLKLKL